jgi:hypothetical protein
MGVIALVAWLSTGGFGLYLLAVWLIEYDREFQTATRTRLPVPVIASHVVLAVGGLVLWSAYLFLDRRVLAVLSVVLLLVVATLGLMMVVRWFRVYRDDQAAVSDAGPAQASRIAIGGVAIASVPGAAGPAAAAGVGADERLRIHRSTAPPERNFPPAVVIAHGVLAVSTLILVALTALGVTI